MRIIHLIILALAALLNSSCAGRGTASGVVFEPQQRLDKAYLDSLANGHDYVDLGICNHLCWATMNLGATLPEETGYFLAWGELEPKPSYLENEYKYYLRIIEPDSIEPLPRMDKYNTNRFQYEELDHLTTLEPEDDAAHVHWGGAWRSPDPTELDSLLKLCDWIPDTIQGHAGYRVQSKRPGYTDRFIFLPNTGAQSGRSRFRYNSRGYYMSRSIMRFTNGYRNCVGMAACPETMCLSFYYRFYGQALRPVFLPNEVLVSQVRIDTTSITLSLTDAPYLLTASVLPRNASFGSVYWGSSDPRVASVDSSGRVTPVGEGICYVAATSTDGTSCKSTCQVKVVNPARIDHPYIDLGICNHLYWATMNVGAESIGENGDYFTWDEACRLNWGDHWRLPTSAEIDSLFHRCDWTWIQADGTYGYLVRPKLSTSGYRDATLFIPASGQLGDQGIMHNGQLGYYWTANTLTAVDSSAVNLSFDSECYFWNYSRENRRFPIRLVYSVND